MGYQHEIYMENTYNTQQKYAVLRRESNYMQLKMCACNPMLTWYIMTTIGLSKTIVGYMH
jgi:hypothetical protein